jgi:hypothetical protein
MRVWRRLEGRARERSTGKDRACKKRKHSRLRGKRKGKGSPACGEREEKLPPAPALCALPTPRASTPAATRPCCSCSPGHAPSPVAHAPLGTHPPLLLTTLLCYAPMRDCPVVRDKKGRERKRRDRERGADREGCVEQRLDSFWWWGLLNLLVSFCCAFGGGAS